MKKQFFKNLLLFVCGFCLYITLEVCFRGYSYVLMGIVGGISLSLILDKINDYISWDMPLQFQMLVGCIAITLMELLSGEFALHVLGIRMWDYSGMWLSMCDDLICPLFSLCWYVISGIGIILADAINYYVMHDQTRPYYVILHKRYYMPERKCH